jgi:hypothetical protein
MSKTAAVTEICAVEGDDSLHDYGGGHGNKGNDFARFWLISELLRLASSSATDYLFVLEYVQDVARFDASGEPTSITLYQLKKKEGNTWDLNSLAGLTAKGKLVKQDSPLGKLLKAVLSFKQLDASAEFVSNTRYKVDLAAGGTAIAMDYVTLGELTPERQAHIGDSIAVAHGIAKADVPLARVGLRYAPIEVNDMRVHVIGAAHGFLKQLSVAHAAQADSFVDALFAKLATASRNTSKCKTWEELTEKRGYGKKQFEQALSALQVLPDQQKRREEVLGRLGHAFSWHVRERMKVEVALTDLTRMKLVGGTLTVPGVDWSALIAISVQAEATGSSEENEFTAIETTLAVALPEETPARTRALAIYAMVEAWTNQTFA